ncbi:MAG: wax ester/triacylglycerol synthase family O-acyltransferase [Acidobacteria bacterium]|nr:wax ester/triacylglycerol synthase family O-acyltransferase [Acidobacteriota bacterium]
MQNHSSSDRLSWGDSVFLYLEREGMPLNVAGVSVLEGEIPFETYLRFVESKLPLIPRFLKRIVPSPFNIGLPSWDYDPKFDLRNHVRKTTLKHGTDAELKTVAGKLFSQVMDREHPLWDLTLVHGLKGKRTAIIARLHHCLADGIAAVGIMSLLMDSSPAVPDLPKTKRPFRIPAPHGAQSPLLDGLTNSYGNFVDRLLSAWTDILNIAERSLAEGGAPPAEEFSSLLPELTSSTERLGFNVLYKGPQKFAWAEISLEEVKAIRQKCGTSVNDVLLALVTSTMRRYSELHGETVKGRLLRMMVPVNVRGTTASSELGNRISLVPVTIPLDIRHPKKLLAAVHSRTEFLKRSHAAELISLAGGLIGILPSSMQAVTGPMISRLHFTPFNMVCTSVPGPQVPLYVLGHKMVHWYPYVPVGGEMAVNCAILSYNGMVYFGFSGDVHIAPDLGRLENFLQASFTELREAARVSPRKKSKKRAPRVKAPVVSKPAPVRAKTVRVSANAPIVAAEAPVSTPDPVVAEDKVLSQMIA